MTMLAFLCRRIAAGTMLVLAVMVSVFVLTKLAPGDPVSAMVGTYPAPPEYRDQIIEKYGLEESIAAQLLEYMRNLITLDLGYSFVNSAEVSDVVLARLPATMLLVLPGIALGSLVGVVAGLVTSGSVRRGVDTSMNVTAILAMAVPSFWLAQILVIVFALQFEWFPSFGMRSVDQSGSFLERAGDVGSHLVLPLIALALMEFASVARIMRGGTIEALSQDYITTAEMKGLSMRATLWRHVLRNASLAVVTVVGNRFGRALAGTVLIESVFGWPGMGLLLKTSVERRDNLTVLGIVFLIAIMVVLANIIQDLLYRVLDPRIGRA